MKDDPSIGTHAQQARVQVCVADALEDLVSLGELYDTLIAVLDCFHEDGITYCDGGCTADIRGLVEQLKPHSMADVAERARELAWDRESIE